MPKLVTKKNIVDIVDLIRERKQFPLLDVPPCRVIVSVEITTTTLIGTPKAPPEAQLKRMGAAAQVVLDHYETTITQECTRFNKEIDDLLKAGDLKEAIAKADTVNHAVKNALLSAEAAASKAVEDFRKAEGQKDKLLKEAQIKTGVKVTFAGIKIATHAVKLAGSHGADVTAYIGIAKAVYEIAMIIKQEMKDEVKLRQDLEAGINAYLEFRTTQIVAAAKNQGLTDTSNLGGFPEAIGNAAKRLFETAKEATKGKDATAIATDIKNLVIKGVTSKLNDVEKARKAYREETTKMRQNVDKVSLQADKLMAEVKKAGTLKEGVKLGAACMQVKGKVTRLSKALDDAIKYLEEAQSLMTDMGLDFSDDTIWQKIKKVDMSTIFSEGKGLLENISDIKDLVDAIAG
jgi:hypothetical protein